MYSYWKYTFMVIKTQDIGQEIKPENLKYLHQVEIVN